MDGRVSAEDLLRRLDQHRDAYLQTFQEVHNLLTQTLTTTATQSPPQVAQLTTESEPQSPLPEPGSPRPSVSRITSNPGRDARTGSTGLSTLSPSRASRTTGGASDDEADADEALYVQTPLESHAYDHDGLREHLTDYEWDEYGKAILANVVDNINLLKQDCLFPTRPGGQDDRSHFSAYQVWDVGSDGAPLAVDFPTTERDTSKAMAIWQAFKEINPPSKWRKAVGRITTVQELSPILFGALHYTMHRTFDMDEIFKHLVSPDCSSADFHRAFLQDPIQQSSFVFNFEYFTIVGEECEPMKWQLADRDTKAKPGHIPLTRCSSVVALALSGKPIRKVKNPARRTDRQNLYGYAYDPFSPWQVLHVQCYPDWKATTDIHDSSKHYVNGVEAFIITLLGEFRDAQKRFDDIFKAVTKLVTPPSDFMFHPEVRDRLLFEDADFTYCRRYFFAYQTLGLMSDSIKAIVDAYEDTFVDDVWAGTHKTIWPLLDQNRARNTFYQKRMSVLRTKCEEEMRNFNKLIAEIDDRRDEIRGLREELFVGTSIEESRKSVEATQATVQQGHNIKLLTLVSIFFLPLSFVTGVFGMTNMPTERHYWMFGIVTATVCVPFFVLIASLNTTSGMEFWRMRRNRSLVRIGNILAWTAQRLRRYSHRSHADREKDVEDAVSRQQNRPPLVPSDSTQVQMARRLRRWSLTQRATSGERGSESPPTPTPGTKGAASVGDGPATHGSRVGRPHGNTSRS